MSRSGYSDECGGWDLIRWRGAVASGMRGKRGQQLLQELADAMDAMPVKELIAEELQIDNQFCALGVVGHARKIDMNEVDIYNRDAVGRMFNISPAMAAEIAYMNDEFSHETPAARWARMRSWVSDNLKPTTKETI